MKAVRIISAASIDPISDFFFFSGGYKWLKYVPNSILKTAQAAEWKIQAWMIGKPPTIAYEGIGYNAPPVAKSQSGDSSPRSSQNLASPVDTKPRPSIGSSTFSEYDDLRDFDGRFESRSTLGIRSQANPEGVYVTKRKTSRGILEILKGSPTVSPQHSQDKEKPSSSKKLKGLRSMGSLKRKSSRATLSRKSEPPSPLLPPPLHIDIGLGLENMAFTTSPRDISGYHLPMTAPYVNGGVGPQTRAGGRRSISFTSSKAATSIPSSPSPSAFATSFTQSVGGQPNHQAALGNALIAASHAESSKGTHSDLLQILNHENHSWGFSYAAYPHQVRVWYGDKDEKIAENAVRWMERTMGPDKCSVKVVKGADHGLMYRSSAVVDVFEWISSSWRDERSNQPFASLR